MVKEMTPKLINYSRFSGEPYIRLRQECMDAIAAFSYQIAFFMTLFFCLIIYYGIMIVSPQTISVLCGEI